MWLRKRTIYLFYFMTTKCGWRQLQEMLSRSFLPRGPTSLATSSMLSGPPHDVYLVSFWFVFVSIMFEYHQIMMTRRDSLRHLATSPPPGLMPLVPCNITEGFSYSSQSFVQFMFFFMCFSKLSFLYFIFCIGHNLIHFRKGCVRTKKIVRVVKIFQLFT